MSGLDAGVQTSYLQYFPLDRPDMVRPPLRMYVPASQVLEAEKFEWSYFDTGDRVLVNGMIPLLRFRIILMCYPGITPNWSSYSALSLNTNGGIFAHK